MARTESTACAKDSGRYGVTIRFGQRPMDRILRECEGIAKAQGWELDPRNSRADIVEAIIQAMVDWHVLGPEPIGVTSFAFNITKQLRKRKRERRLWAVK